MLYLDTLRGKDSTGLVAVRQNRTIDSLKHAMPGFDFIELKEFDSFTKLTDVIWMGHNRLKTVGAASRQNAHPFLVLDDEGYVNLIGAHNGTINNKSRIPNDTKFGTDSEALFNWICEVGPREAVSHLHGAWALVWYDFRTNQLNMLRNKERPLCYAYSEDGKTLYWASEAWMLRAAADRRGLKIKGIFYPNENTLYQFQMPDKGYPTKIPEPTTEGGLEGAKTQASNFQKQEKSQTYRGYGAWWGEDGDDWEQDPITKIYRKKPEQGGEEKAEEGKTEGKEKIKVIPPVDEEGNPLDDDIPEQLLDGFEGEKVEKSLAKLIAEEGCGWCGSDIKLTDPYAWLDMDTMVCKKCLRGEHKAFDQEEEKSNVVPFTPIDSVLTERQRKALEEKRTGGISIK